MSCPKTEQEFQDYVFQLIGQNLGGIADNYKEIFSREYNWNGVMMRIPENTPGKGYQLPSDAPFYGLTQQTSGGVPKGRLWIPAAIADENGYFTRYIQYIKDTPNGQYQVNFLWDWRWIAGNEYVPICNGGTNPGPTPNPELEVRVAILEAQVKALDARVVALEQKPQSRRITLKADNGKYVTAEVTSNPPILSARGDNPDSWQQFLLDYLD